MPIQVLPPQLANQIAAGEVGGAARVGGERAG
ncbi:DNA mismatch repair protein MutL [Klebsiella pneumoniae]|uniref:DNA mismatch repair protein MutL n=1 Tax=Klebsiella pneumoniae TaxID=573 RepID=A0A447RXJ3_KLEPN|nr:DNA mismatch repair protein MutL [Klebsiella pneumoniae]